MPKRRVVVGQTSDNVMPLRPALTPEARENQLISLAMDLVEERIRNGTATSQETTHFLKLGSVRNQLESEKLKKEIELLEAKKQDLESSSRIEKLYADAMEAMKTYSGQEETLPIGEEDIL